MEGTLNLLWLVIAVAALVVWRAQWLRSWRRFAPLGAVALGIALVMLFPEISITDDLNAEQAVMEESSRATMKARHATQRCLSAGKQTVHFAVRIHPGLPAVAWIVIGTITSPEAPLLSWGLVLTSQARSPPSTQN